jgi:hypothetical protein
MATRTPTVGIAHTTVVPTNLEERAEIDEGDGSRGEA